MVTVPGTFAPRRGDDCTLAIPVQNDDGTFATLRGAQARWTYGYAADGAPLSIKTNGSGLEIGNVEIDGVTVAAVIVSLSAAETSALQAYRTYAFQCRVTFSNEEGGGSETVLTGSFVAEPSQG